MHPAIDAFTSRCEAMRESHTPVARVFQECLQRLGWPASTLEAWRALPVEEVAGAGPQARLFRTALVVAGIVEGDVAAPYHNRDHTAEAVLAGETLMANEPLSARAKAHQGLRLLAAMVAHDACHTGGFGMPRGSMEEASAEVFAKAWKAFPEQGGGAGHGHDEMAIIRTLIMGTEFSEGPTANAALFAAAPRQLVPRLRVLANDADVLASVIPETGPARAQLLAREWASAGKAAEGAAARVRTWAGRLDFLGNTLLASDSARAMGVARMRDDEIMAIKELSPRALDAMPAREAQDAVRCAMARPRERARLHA